MAFCTDTVLTVDDLASLPKWVPPGDSLDGDELVPFAETERRAILHVLQETRGDKFAAARLLGIGKTTLYRKLKKYATPPIPVRQ